MLRAKQKYKKTSGDFYCNRLDQLGREIMLGGEKGASSKTADHQPNKTIYCACTKYTFQKSSTLHTITKTLF